MIVPVPIADPRSADAVSRTLMPGTDADEVVGLAASLDASSPLTIARFGDKVGELASRYADELLASARTDDLDDVGRKLTQIVVAAQEFDLSSVDSKWARAPLIGGIVRSLAMTREKALARFGSVEEQVDRLVENIRATLKRLESRAESFDQMYRGVAEEHRLLATHVAAAELVKERLDAEISSATGAATETAGAERLGSLEASRDALKKRIGDLAVLQHAAMQTLPMIRIMQSSNVVLIEKFQTIQRLTLPSWKRTFVMALALDEQREAVKLADSIDDATNHFMRRNSEILHENAVGIAKANQRLVVDVETLQQVHANVIQTFTDMRKVQREGAQKRDEVLEQLAGLRNDMTRSLSGSGA